MRLPLVLPLALTLVTGMCSCHGDGSGVAESAEPDSGQADTGAQTEASTTDAAAPPPVDCGASTVPLGVCTDLWCWENPLPQGNTLRMVQAFAPDDVWAVLEDEALRFNGSTWSRFSLPTSLAVRALWGSGGEDVWVTAENPQDPLSSEVFRWDGASWAMVDLPSPHMSVSQIHGTSHDDVWLGGNWAANAPGLTKAKPLLLHFDGAAWHELSPDQGMSLGASAALAADDVWASVWLGDGTGQLLHYDGIEWAVVEGAPMVSRFLAFDSGEFFALAYSDSTSGASRVFFWDGATLTEVWDAPMYVVDMWGVSATDTWFLMTDLVANSAMVHFDGTEWAVGSSPFAASPRAFGGTSENDVWLVGEGGGLAHFDGTAWTPAPNLVQGARSFRNIAGTATDNVWIAGDPHGRLKGSGDATSAFDLGSGNGGTGGVGGAGGSDGYYTPASGGSGGNGFDDYEYGSPVVYQFTGASWSEHDVGHNVNDIWSAGPNDTWAVGDGISHHDGSAWTEELGSFAGKFFAVHGSAPDNVFAAGERLYRFDGFDWHHVLTAPSSATFMDVWVVGSQDVWISTRVSMLSGEASAEELFHYDGVAAHEAIAPLDECQGVRGNGSGHLWAYGRCGLWHHDGTDWQQITDTRVSGPILPLAEDSIWMLSDNAVQYYDGLDLTWQETGSSQYLRDIYGGSPCDIRLVGDHGAMLIRSR